MCAGYLFPASFVMVQIFLRRYLLGSHGLWVWLATFGILHTLLVTKDVSGEVEFTYGWAGVEEIPSSGPEADEALGIC